MNPTRIGLAGIAVAYLLWTVAYVLIHLHGGT